MDVTADDLTKPLGLDARPRPVPPLAGTGGADPRRPHRRAPRRLCRLRPRCRRPARRRAARDRCDRAAGTAAAAGCSGRCAARPRPGRRSAAPERRRGRGRLRRVDHAPERLRCAWRGDHPGPGTRERKACAGSRPPPRRTEPARAPAEGWSGRRQALARLCPPGHAADRRRAPRGENRAPRHRPRHQPERHGRRHRPPSGRRDPRLRALRRRSRQDRGGGAERGPRGHAPGADGAVRLPGQRSRAAHADDPGEAAGEPRQAALGARAIHGLYQAS